ncbi:hypothetical protein NGF19_06625 [Streptomyces sp. RY43-2]|uniref:Uncharacterized protein n=1 Tax=Streptomyces macrolidinus TaxID=2952607 RepID=A0ABT0Z9N5_9ACTN|nr:hypothetical protein [Streptomyces macrolidinus]MCN9240470.1 hypothetical protein [Streptomyces macrolidinus]
MEGIIAGALAVVGTLLGSVIAHHYQEKSARRAEARAHSHQQQQLLFDNCAAFISLAEDYRRAQYDRWSRWDADPTSEEATAARAEAYRLYVETRSSASRLKLISGQEDVHRLADQAGVVLELTSAIIRTDDRADMLQRGRVAQAACDAFVAEANAVLHGSAP